MVTAATVLYTLFIAFFVLQRSGNAAAPKRVDVDEILGDYMEDYYPDPNTNTLDDMTKSSLCPKGYKFNAKGVNCDPECIYGCENGKCTAPDVCQCEKGFEFALNKCVPICTKPCKYGYCSSPGVCSCFFGTVWNEKLSSCVFKIETRYKRGLYGAELLYMQPWTTKQPAAKKPTKRMAPKKTLKVTIV